MCSTKRGEYLYSGRMTGRKGIVMSVVVLLLLGGGLSVWLLGGRQDKKTKIEDKTTENIVKKEVGEKSMQLTSPVFSNSGTIPAKYTCDGDDVNPPLAIAAVPEGTESLALIMDDPDAPAGTWDHWVIFNIPPATGSVAVGTEPAGVHGKGTSGNLNYYGPCPPDREHRYFFKLYALDTTLDLKEGVSKVEVERAMAGHILQQTELIGLYERQ